MPNGTPLTPDHLHAAKTVREAALALARLIARQVVQEGSATSKEDWQDAEDQTNQP